MARDPGRRADLVASDAGEGLPSWWTSRPSAQLRLRRRFGGATGVERPDFGSARPEVRL
jgi:hypothetical protein